MREVPEAEGGTAKVLQPAVDGLRWAVARCGAVEEREDVRGALLQRAAEATDLLSSAGTPLLTESITARIISFALFLSGSR